MLKVQRKLNCTKIREGDTGISRNMCEKDQDFDCTLCITNEPKSCDIAKN